VDLLFKMYFYLDRDIEDRVTFNEVST